MKQRIIEIINNANNEENTAIKNISFNGYEIPLEISQNNANKTVLILPGIIYDSADELTNQSYDVVKPQCLNVSIHQNELHLEQITTQYAACPVPLKQSGTFILNLVDEIAKEYRLAKITLDDISRVICPANKKVAMLGHLSIFKTGLTWYGTHGFYSELGKAQDQLAGDLVRKLNVNTVKAELNNDPNFKNDARTGIYSTALSEYLKSNPNKYYLGQFFTWVWDNNCTIYDDIFGLLFGPSGIHSNSMPAVTGRKLTKLIQL